MLLILIGKWFNGTSEIGNWRGRRPYIVNLFYSTKYWWQSNAKIVKLSCKIQGNKNHTNTGCCNTLQPYKMKMLTNLLNAHLELNRDFRLRCFQLLLRNPFGFKNVEKCSLVKRILHLDVSTQWVIFSSRQTYFPNNGFTIIVTIAFHCVLLHY